MSLSFKIQRIAWAFLCGLPQPGAVFSSPDVPPGTTVEMSLIDLQEQVVEAKMVAFSGQHNPGLFTEFFPNQQQPSCGTWRICPQPSSGGGDPRAFVDILFIDVVTQGPPQLGTINHSVVNGDCSDGGETLCLNDRRFKVEVDWKRQTAAGKGTADRLSEDSGAFWFFDPGNFDLLVQVLDGWAVNDHFWVFYSATTDVEFTLKVTDTLSDETESYSKALGQMINPVTDVQAFATCP